MHTQFMHLCRVVAASLAILALTACAPSTHGAATSNASVPGPDALAIAAGESAMEGTNGLDATIDDAYWWLSDTGPVAFEDSNFRGRCAAASVMHVSLIGQFPRISVLPPPGLDALLVTQVDLLADSETGEVCRLSVRTETVDPPLRATGFAWPT